ncbi:MAG: purine-cytosine permease family protein [Acidimicrobiales bacterium]
MSTSEIPVETHGDELWSIERNGINPIGENQRHGRARELFWVWCAANIGILGITYGVYLVTPPYSLSFAQALIGGIVGTVLSFVLVGVIALAGKMAGAPTLVLSRASFGVRGNVIPTAISYVSLVGWEIILVALATLAAESLLSRLGLPSSNFVTALAFLLIALIAISIALLGHATIVRVQTIFTWLFAAMTVVYFILVLPKISFAKVTALHAGTASGWLGGISIVMAGLGIGWVNAGADYSRYLPRSVRSGAVVGWTTFGSSIAPVILIFVGILIGANHPSLASSANPIAALAAPLPTWFLVPYLITAVGGLVAGTLLDVYSSGLNLLTLGLKLPRSRSVLIDGVLMIIGNIYVLFLSKTFFAPFEGFLITLGVPLAAWAAIFIVDLLMHRLRRGYREEALYDPRGYYGAFSWAGVVSFVIAVVIGLGLVSSSAPIFSWAGYLGGSSGIFASSSIGLFVGFVVAAVLYGVLSPINERQRAGVRAQ